VTLASHLSIMSGWIRTSVCCLGVFCFNLLPLNICFPEVNLLMKFLPLLQCRGDETDLNITFLSINQWSCVCFLLQGVGFCHLMNSVDFLLFPSNFLLGTSMGCEIPLSGTGLIAP